MNMIHRFLACFILIFTIGISACTKHEVEVKPIRVEPIYIKIDVNIRVDKELDDFFGDLDDVTEVSPQNQGREDL